MDFSDFLNNQLKDKDFAQEYQKANQVLELGVSIALRRVELGLTQHALATKANLKQPMLARIEKGQLPTLPTLQKLAQALDCSIIINGNNVSIKPHNSDLSQAA